jgi:hypothetical protein
MNGPGGAGIFNGPGTEILNAGGGAAQIVGLGADLEQLLAHHAIQAALGGGATSHSTSATTSHSTTMATSYSTSTTASLATAAS